MWGCWFETYLWDSLSLGACFFRIFSRLPRSPFLPLPSILSYFSSLLFSPPLPLSHHLFLFIGVFAKDVKDTSAVYLSLLSHAFSTTNPSSSSFPSSSFSTSGKRDPSLYHPPQKIETTLENVQAFLTEPNGISLILIFISLILLLLLLLLLLL